MLCTQLSRTFICRPFIGRCFVRLTTTDDKDVGRLGRSDPPGGGTRPENWWGCAAGRWKLDPKRSRKKLNLGPKRSIFVKIGSFCTPKDSFAVGGWEKVPQKDRARSCQSEKRGSKPRHICITHHTGSTPPPGSDPLERTQIYCAYSKTCSTIWLIMEQWVSNTDQQLTAYHMHPLNKRLEKIHIYPIRGYSVFWW